jgi:hypothetical protein
MVNLYKKYWYIPKYKIVYWIDNPIILDRDDIIEINKTIDNYKKWFKEEKLWYTVILEKDNFD